jgi:endoglucanase
MKIFNALWVAVSILVASSAALAAPVSMVQVNLAGAEFAGGTLPGRPNYDYMFPTITSLNAWKANGVQVIRLPVLWERLQPVLDNPLDPVYAKLIDKTLELAAARGMSVILDIHNYGTYRTKLIGSLDVPLRSYANLMWRIAQRWNGNPGLNGYDIMNEPHDAFDAGWPAAAQAGINGIRRYDTAKPIYVEGRSWSSAARWASVNGALLNLRDPSNNLIFSAHLYFDADASGSYKTGPGDDFDLDVGVKRATPFIEWLKRNNRRGHIGESGIPGNDPRWSQAMDHLMAYLQKHCVPLTYWAAGPLWGSYPLSIEPQAGVVRAQWTTLAKYVQTQNCP